MANKKAVKTIRFMGFSARQHAQLEILLTQTHYARANFRIDHQASFDETDLVMLNISIRGIAKTWRLVRKQRILAGRKIPDCVYVHENQFSTAALSELAKLGNKMHKQVDVGIRSLFSPRGVTETLTRIADADRTFAIDGFEKQWAELEDQVGFEAQNAA